MFVSFGPYTQGITFVARILAVIIFTLVLSMLFQRNNSEFRGNNKKWPVINCALIVYGLRFCKDNLIELAIYLTNGQQTKCSSDGVMKMYFLVVFELPTA